MKLNVCILGCGAMGNVHANAWKTREDSRIVALFDPLEDRLEKLAGETGATAAKNWQDAILQDGVNVVSVCTPVCFHSEIACFAAKNGRHVLSEKPLALTIEQADAMVQAAKENGVLLSTSLQYRGFHRNLKYRELFQAGAFGGPIFVRYADIREVRPKLAMHRRSMNGGPVIDMANHYFDLMRFFTGEEPKSVFASGHVFGKGKKRLAGIEDLAIDAAQIQVVMQGGHTLDVIVNWGMPEGFSGFSEEMITGPDLLVRGMGKGIQLQFGDRKETWEPNAGDPGTVVRINDIADAIQERRQPTVTGEDGRIALKVSLAALESVRTGNVVQL